MWPQGPPNTTPCARGGPQGGGPGFADITGVRLRPLPRPRQLRRGAQALPRTVGCGCGSAATPAPGPWKPAGRSSRPCLLSTTSKRAHFKSRAGAEGARMRACRRCEVCGLRGLTPPRTPAPGSTAKPRISVTRLLFRSFFSAPMSGLRWGPRRKIPTLCILPPGAVFTDYLAQRIKILPQLRN